MQPRKNRSRLLPASAARKKTKESTPQPNFPQVYPTPYSHAHHQVSLEAAEIGADQRLPAHGGGVHRTLPEERASQTRRRQCMSFCIQEEFKKIEQLRGLPMNVGTLEEFIDEDHCIVSSTMGPEYYVPIMSFVDKDQLEPNSSVLLNHRGMSIVGIMQDDVDPLLNVMKVEKAPLESYADIGGLETQIQEIKEAVELPLTHPEVYEDMGIKPPKGVILYG